MDHLSYQCAQLLADEDMLAFLRAQRYDMAVIDAFNPCSFILTRKLGKGEMFVGISSVDIILIILNNHNINSLSAKNENDDLETL